MSRILKAVLGEHQANINRHTNVLVVGMGGIGCQVMKAMIKSGFRTFTIVDYDLIEQTNLNRQFYFRQENIGQSKSEVAKMRLLELDPTLQIKSISQSLYSLSYAFYLQFDLIVSALDSRKARSYLCKRAMEHNIPMIDAGTMAYNGQAYPIVRYVTNCYNCTEDQNIEEEHNFAVCTIRTKPQKPIHCAVWARSIYQDLCGQQINSGLGDKIKLINYLHDKKLEECSEGDLRNLAYQILHQIFQGNSDICTLKNKEMQNMSQLYEEDTVWSLQAYLNIYFQSFCKLMKRKIQQSLPPKFQKDDDDVMAFVFCLANLRTSVFIKECKMLRYLSFYECKDLIGRVFYAIASTNSIAAALQVRQTINVLSNCQDKYRYISIGAYTDEKLSPCFGRTYNNQCESCSRRVIDAAVYCDMSQTTFEDIEAFGIEHLFSYGRDIASGSFTIIKFSNKQSSNRKKYLNFNQKLLLNTNQLPLQFPPKNEDPILIKLTVIDRKQIQGIQFIKPFNRKEHISNLIEYYRKRQEENAKNQERYESEDEFDINDIVVIEDI